MLDLVQGRAPELLRGLGIGRFPVMLLDYMGSLGGYVTVPFLWLFGAGAVAARVQPLFFSALTIVLVYVVAARWFGRPVAALAAILLALQPSFVWFSRQGVSVTSVMSFFAWASLALLSDFPTRAISQSPGRLVGAGVILGLGLWAKLPFLWWLMMLAMMAAVFLMGTGWRNRFNSLGGRRLSLVALGFVIGAAPLIYFNIAGLLRDGVAPTAALVFGSLFRPTQQFGVNNLDFFKNLGTSWSNFKVFIDGSYFWYNGVTFSNIFALPVLALAVVVGAVFALRQQRPALRRWLALALALPVAIFMGSFTVSGQWATHFFIISGVPQVLVACATIWLAQAVMQRSAPRFLRSGTYALAALLIAAPVSRDLWVNLQHHNKLAETGGSGRFSDAVYKVADYLDAAHATEPVALDWGIEKQIRVLTADRVRPLEIFGYTPDPTVADDAFRERARALLQDENRRYIVLWDQFAVYNRRAEFTRLANDMGKQVTEVFIAHERSGLPVYVVLEAR